ncbi:PREDICTED: nudix hydrolase 13, mitochondrial isoform X4 [Brassica oleracea var. oleracea]|uniref:nudix hydrolase 13, mitochondrial isoform X4 n=1 Tax=Brassica oleracea var. oleracea TaxID=109376 RepID=UPI0006A6CEA3|nr:PREDICTED: nudix hydrolase 13, mitochondrial isoform X4 [Brassica oleracea var. oleracea]
MEAMLMFLADTNRQTRTGRDRQRYDNNFRLVSGCIPYRLLKDEEDSSVDHENKLQVLMVSSPNRHDLVFPKGGWEDDETVLEAASREAMEEAGVKGILREDPLGVWEFRSKSSCEEAECCGGCKGYMFALEVKEELAAWPEQENRERRWSALEEFLRVVTEDGSSKEETLSPSGISKRGERQIDSRYCFVVN